jgi:hypothetical protein
MSLLNIPIPNLLNGVSQQPANLRFPTQCEVQENAYSSIVEGLGKRPPTEHVAEITSGAGNDTTTSVKIHGIDRGDQAERYVAVFNGKNASNCIRVFDINGIAKTVNFQNDNGTVNTEVYSYLECTDPSTQLKVVSIADYTFIVNTTKVVSMANTTSPALSNDALIWIKQGAYNSKYSILGDNTSSYSTGSAGTFPAGTSFDGEGFAGLSNADAGAIAANLKAGLTSGSGWTISRVGYTIHIAKTSSFAIDVSDSVSGNGIGLIRGSTQSFSDLPLTAKDGMVVKIEGLPDSTADDYWVKFVGKGTAGSISEGLWTETVAPGIKTNINPKTMPVVLIRQSDGTFMAKFADGTTPTAGAPVGSNYSGASWGARICGDEETNPNPSFVGGLINDLFLFRGRLGFLSGESVCLSEAGEFFNFWRTTVTQVVDQDPIDVSSSYPAITLFRHAIPFSDRLVLFSDRVQFTLTTRQAILTGLSVTMTPTSNYDTLKICRPAVVNDGIFFPFDRGNYSGVRQMAVNTNDSETLTAPDISAHIPKYIPGSIFEIAASSHDNVLACLATGDQGSLYIYKWYDADNDRIQSSWSKWTFTGATIRGMVWMQSTLYVVMTRGTKLFLEKITIEPNRKDTYSKFVTALDRRSTPLSVSYNSATNQTAIEFQYPIQAGVTMAVVKKATVSSEAGYMLPILQTIHGASTSTVYVTGNWGANDVWLGQQYTMKYRFSQPYLKQSDGTRTVSLASGRFQIRAMQLIYDNSSSFSVIVTHDFTNTQYTYNWSGNYVGTGQAVIGNVPVETGSYRFPVYGKNTEVLVEIQNPTHLPSNFMSAEIEASYDSRSRRV